MKFKLQVVKTKLVFVKKGNMLNMTFWGKTHFKNCGSRWAELGLNSTKKFSVTFMYSYEKT